VAPDAAAIRRGSLGRHPPHRRRYGHAGRTLAEQQAGAEPLRRRTSEPARGDGQPRRHARRAAQPTANYLAARSTEARALGIPEPPDPSRYTNVKDPTTPFHFSFPDVTGKIVSDTDAMFRGKVVILAIGGSWCPNCHDEAPFLSELYKTYHAKGLEIVGLMFENDPDPVGYRPRVQSFIKRYNVQYPLLIPGTTQMINEKLPQLVNFGAYPTSIYLGRDGKVRSVHAGFASPATGEEHVRLKQELRELTERLLAESAGGSADK
jgi:Peroxiredoxin